VARLIVSRLRTARGLNPGGGGARGTFAVYGTALFTAAVAGLGGTGAFAAPIVTRILMINAAALAGLAVLYRLGVAVGISRRPASRLPVASS
jgi:hypothetical protein